jgi:protein trunk
MQYSWKVISVFYLLHILKCETRTISQHSYEQAKNKNDDETNEVCDQLPPVVLSEILGPAFNSRYMSIEEPKKSAPGVVGSNGKRMADDELDFYVDDTYWYDISDKPAWEVRYGDETMQEFNARLQQTEEYNREKRASVRRGGKQNSGRPWECQSKIRWIDLGSDYFPRFLRTVECTRHNCWYGQYTCQPRSFTVKILRRRGGECVKPGNLKSIGNDGLQHELKEMWVWEERAVNFCCDCAPAW